MSTLTDLLTKLNTEYIKIDPNNKIWSIVEKTSFINGGFSQIQKDGGYRWRENMANYTVNTSAGTRQYSLPTDFVKLDMVRYDTTQLYPVDKKETKLLNPNNTQGSPNKYYIYGAYLGVDPVPDAVKVLDLDYFKRLPTITAIQDCDLPSDFDNAICAYAAYLAFNSVEKQQKAITMLSDYQFNLNTLLATYLYSDMAVNFGIQRIKAIGQSESILY